MRKIEVVFRHNDVIDEDIRGKHAVIIDVLRATSVMTAALANGALSIRTTIDIDLALKMKREEPELVLAGERNALIIDGFQLGNSPLEMTRETVGGKHILMSTTNGTQSVAAAQKAEQIWVACFNNISEVSQSLLEETTDIYIICSGTNQQFSLDDAYCAGMLVDQLTQKADFKLADTALAARMISLQSPPPKKALKNCFHYQVLQKKGMQKDLDYCLSIDIIKLIPKWNGDCFIV